MVPTARLCRLISRAYCRVIDFSGAVPILLRRLQILQPQPECLLARHGLLRYSVCPSSSGFNAISPIGFSSLISSSVSNKRKVDQRRAPFPDPLRTDKAERRVRCDSFGVVEILVAQSLIQFANQDQTTMGRQSRSLGIKFQGDIERESKLLILFLTHGECTSRSRPHHI